MLSVQIPLKCVIIFNSQPYLTRFVLPCKMLKFMALSRRSTVIPSVASWATKRALSAQPTESIKIPPAELVECLENYGIVKNVSSQMLSQLPNHHILNEVQLSKVMNAWSSCQFGQDKLAHILATNPGYLLLDPQQIKNYFLFLSSLFSQKYVLNIFINSPQIFNEKESCISSKFDFTQNVLNVSNSDVINSLILNYPIEHLRVRYEFLKRCGLYKKAKRGEQIMSNPSLKNMYCTSDEEFARKVARLSLEEFEAFTSLYELEESDD